VTARKHNTLLREENQGRGRGYFTCLTPEKPKYATLQEADEAAASIGDAQIRGYLCPCGWSHMTSRPDRRQVSRKGRKGHG
jgi:hypothetical protein